MLKVIYFAIIFLVIPAIILAFFIISALLPRAANSGNARVSGRAGFWAGLVVFAAFAVSAIGSVTSPDFHVEKLPSFSWLGILAGVVGGFAFLLVVERILPSRGIGILTLILSAASTIGLFSYLFTSGTRDFMMYLTLGLLLGVLVNVIIAPQIARGILGSSEDN